MTKHKRKPLHQSLHLDLLKTCRQIYHEAVLKPFSVNEFHHFCESRHFPGRELSNFVKALVPTQARAIKHLRVVFHNAPFLRHTIVQQLKGLERLEVQIALADHYYGTFGNDMWKPLDDFSANLGVEALAEFSLKSLRITTEVESDYVLSTNPDAAAVVAWQKRLESRLMGSATLNDDQGLSADGDGVTDS
jgi:hypothetical protein